MGQSSQSCRARRDRSLMSARAVWMAALLCCGLPPAAAPADEAIPAGTARAGAAVQLALDGRSDSLRVDPRVPGNFLPTLANSLVVRAGSGPIVATWTGALLGTDGSADIIIRFEAVPCPDPNVSEDCAKPFLALAILATPHVPPSGVFVPFFNYGLRAGSPGYTHGTHTATAAWLPGSLTANLFYRINVRVAHFEDLDHRRARIRERLLSVQIFDLATE